MIYQLICGAEIHVELNTKSKMFCGCKNDPFGAEKPNIYTCPVCLGMPGALPVPNKKAVEDCIVIGLALGCKIAKVSKFDRKHYFYPDLPKGYQISQYDEPLCYDGLVETSHGPVRITRVHMEEDTAKMNHAVVGGKKVSLIDFNRSSVPLVEIVTEPDIKSPEQAKEFLKKIRDIIRALGVSSCDMEKGSMRLEANISLSKNGTLPSYKVEVKNINSFRFFANSLEFEYKRQAEILDQGEIPVQETRGYRDGKGTVSQRRKEGAADYRYFPDPDIPPLVIDENWLSLIKSRLPKLPDAVVSELVSAGVIESAAKIIVNNQTFLDFIATIKALDPSMVKTAANDLVNKKIHKKTLAHEYLNLKKNSLSELISDEETLIKTCKKVLSDNPAMVTAYKNGKTNILGFFVGQVMHLTNRKADPLTVNKLLLSLL